MPTTTALPPGVFRLALATMVVISHFTKLAIGTAAVELFFVLSGFWIYRMYEGKYRRAARPGLLFIASRLLRLLPVFLLFNTLAVALHFVLQDDIAERLTALGILPNTLLLGYASQAARPMVPAWSLDIELQFYLLFPLIFAVVQRLHRSALAIAIAALLCGGADMAIVLQNDSDSVFPFIGFFLMGLLSARFSWRPSRTLTVTSTVLAAGGVAALLAIPAWRGLVMIGLGDPKFEWNVGVNFILAVLLIPLALSSVYGRSNRRDRTLGDLSYVVYCSHWMAVMIATRYFADLDRFRKAPAIAGLLVVTYLISLAVLHYFDRPISRRRERWIDRHAAIVSTAPPPPETPVQRSAQAVWRPVAVAAEHSVRRVARRLASRRPWTGP